MTYRVFLGICLVCLTGCLSSNSTSVVTPVTSPTVEIPSMTSGTPDETPRRILEEGVTRVKCPAGDFSISLIRYIPEDRWDIDIVGHEKRWVLPTPSFNEYINFGAETVAKDKGFIIKADWGSVIQHQFQYSFVCTSSGFNLVKIDHVSFNRFGDDYGPTKRNSRKIVPPVPIEKFMLSEYFMVGEDDD